jgi:hypothetical protein
MIAFLLKWMSSASAVFFSKNSGATSAYMCPWFKPQSFFRCINNSKSTRMDELLLFYFLEWWDCPNITMIWNCWILHHITQAVLKTFCVC